MKLWEHFKEAYLAVAEEAAPVWLGLAIFEGLVGAFLM